MDHAEKLKVISEFNELAQNGEYSEAIDMIIADFDISLFNLPSRKKFIQYCNSMVVQDTDYSNEQKNQISKRLSVLQTLTEKLMDNSISLSDKDLSKMEPHIRIGYGITDMFENHFDFCNSLDYCFDNYTYNKLVSLFFQRIDISNPIHLSRKTFYLAKILDSAGRNGRKISLKNSKDFIDFGLTSSTHGYNEKGLFCLDSSLASEVAKMVVDSKNKEVGNNFFTTCCERNHMDYLVPMLDSGYKSITNGISIAIDRHHFGMATLILKYKPRKFTLSMVQWLCDKYNWHGRRYANHLNSIKHNKARSSLISEAIAYAKISVDIVNCIQYAIDRGADEASMNYINYAAKTVIEDHLQYACTKDMDIIESSNIPPFRCFDINLKQQDSHESSVVR